MDPAALLESFGYLIIFICIFIECGVLIGLVLPLPSYSLLFVAGVFANSDKLNLLLIILVGALGAIAGYIAGYYTGMKYGRKLFYEKNTGRYFTAQQGRASEKFMKKYGYSTLVISRWLPIMHNIAPLFSGVARTPLAPFMAANVIGAVLWAASTSYAGYYFGQVVPNAQYYIIPFVFAVILLMNSPFGKRLAVRLLKKADEQ